MKPMLATKVDLEKLRFPCYVSPKLDGIRCVIHNGVPLTRSLKEIPNKYIRNMLKQHAAQLEGFDGELVVGNHRSPSCFNTTSSAVMRFDGEPDFKFMVFDVIGEGGWYDRWVKRHMLDINGDPHFVEYVEQVEVRNLEELNVLEELFTSEGYEGIMLRNPDGLYKFGRSTMREQYLMKLKRFEDFEARVVGFEEKMYNENELETDNLGHAKRSSKASGMVPAGVLGALICRSPLYADTFNVGSGFDDMTRRAIWLNKDKYLGLAAKIKHQPSGAKDKPRFPTFIGWRSAEDI
jgi:DNA ligase-1